MPRASVLVPRTTWCSGRAPTRGSPASRAVPRSGRRPSGWPDPGSSRGTPRRRRCRPSTARRSEEHEGNRKVEGGDEGEDQDGRQRGHRELRKVLAEVHLELLHALDHGDENVTGAGSGEVRGPESDDLVV